MSARVTIPEGSFDALRQGWRIYRSAAGVFTGQMVLICLVLALFFISLVAAHMLPEPRPGMPMVPVGFGVSVFAFVMGITQMILEMGSMRSMAQVIDGGRARIADLWWGVRRGEVWLLAVVIEVVNIVLGELSGLAMQASGLRETGNPKHPFLALHGPAIPLVIMGGVFLMFAIINNTIMLAMATASRYGQPAFASLRAALGTFTRGYRRFLWINLAWLLMLCSVMVVLGIGAVIVVVLVRMLSGSALAAGLHAVLVIAGVLVGAALVVLFVIAVFASLVAILASYVAASGALKVRTSAGQA
ncbi:MAG: hypothetical protein M0Z76_07065 [Gammaproteobacteria bacterium]|nr:hypothetical protein [Gammaproteobacteria bacterium]